MHADGFVEYCLRRSCVHVSQCSTLWFTLLAPSTGCLCRPPTCTGKNQSQSEMFRTNQRFKCVETNLRSTHASHVPSKLFFFGSAVNACRIFAMNWKSVLKIWKWFRSTRLVSCVPTKNCLYESSLDRKNPSRKTNQLRDRWAVGAHQFVLLLFVQISEIMSFGQVFFIVEFLACDRCKLQMSVVSLEAKKSTWLGQKGTPNRKNCWFWISLAMCLLARKKSRLPVPDVWCPQLMIHGRQKINPKKMWRALVPFVFLETLCVKTSGFPALGGQTYTRNFFHQNF